MEAAASGRVVPQPHADSVQMNRESCPGRVDSRPLSARRHRVTSGPPAARVPCRIVCVWRFFNLNFMTSTRRTRVPRAPSLRTPAVALCSSRPLSPAACSAAPVRVVGRRETRSQAIGTTELHRHAEPARRHRDTGLHRVRDGVPAARPVRTGAEAGRRLGEELDAQSPTGWCGRSTCVTASGRTGCRLPPGMRCGRSRRRSSTAVGRDRRTLRACSRA